MREARTLQEWVLRSLLLQLLLLGLAGPATFAAPLFQNPRILAGGDAQSVGVGDFNGDGRQDLAVPNECADPACKTGALEILLGDGELGFIPRDRYLVNYRPQIVLVGDFNNDRHQDLVLTNGSLISVLLGNGDGSFAPDQTLYAGNSPALAVGDFNNDGRQDLVAINDLGRSAFGSVSVLIGNGDGTFGPETRFEAGVRPLAVAVGDFDGDGHQDLAVANSRQEPTEFELSSDTVSVLYGNGDGAFAPQVRLFVYTRRPVALLARDLNGDGRDDLEVLLTNAYIVPPTSFIKGAVEVFLSEGATGFAASSAYGAGDRPISFAAGDFNVDGSPDLVAADRFDLSTFLGSGNGTFQTKMLSEVRATVLAVGDLNADGRPDLLGAGGSTLPILVGNGDGTFGVHIPHLETGLDPTCLAIGDFNSDGNQDMAIANRASNDISVFLGNGRGGFSPEVRYGVGPGPVGIAAMDLDRDGDEDLVVANSYGWEVSVLRGNGDGSFAAESRFEAGGSPFSVAVSDFNHDGIPDLAVANSTSNDVSVFLGSGHGDFVGQVRYAAGGGPVSIAEGDFNADGNPDLVVANECSQGDRSSCYSDVSVLLGRSDGTFAPQIRYPVDRVLTLVAVLDYDGDSRQDLAVTSSGSNALFLLKGQGDGTFVEGLRLPTGFSPFWMGAGDLDGDSKQDLVVANHASADVSVFLGRGDGTYDPEARFGAGINPFAAGIADLNFDHRPDLVVTNGCFFSGSIFTECPNTIGVSILFNQTTSSNHPPVANARADLRIECASLGATPVLLDGSLSSDPDSAPDTNDDIVSFEWFENHALPGQVSLGIGTTLSVSLPLGPHAITLRVTDSQGETSTDALVVSVVDSTPPSLSCPAAVTAECASPDGTSLSPGIPSASDACAGTLLHFGVDRNPPTGGIGPCSVLDPACGVYPLGTTRVTFTATDPSGNSASCTTTVTVADTTPPALGVAASPLALWPPNHRMVPVQAQVAAADVCDPVPAMALLAVASSEPDDAPGGGDGNTKDDIQGTDIGTADLGFTLRAERAGTGPGRVYTVTYTATDRSGNSISATSTVVVPHDESGVVEPVLVTAEASAAGTLLRWSEAPGALSYNVVRGAVGSLREAADRIDLGEVRCVESGSAGAVTSGNEDAALPLPGGAFFYLVEYSAASGEALGIGSLTSFGTEAVAKPRLASAGGCLSPISGSGNGSRRLAR